MGNGIKILSDDYQAYQLSTASFAYKSGRVVTLTMNGETFVSSGAVSVTIPAECRPPVSVVTPVMVVRSQDNAYFLGYMYVNSNGDINCYGVVNNIYAYFDGIVYATVTYIT